MKILNSSQIREADRLMIEEKSFPGIILMENAGRMAAERIQFHFPDKEILFFILVGPGNNGGDGLVIARILHLKKRKVKLLFAEDPVKFKGDAKTNNDLLSHLPIEHYVFPKFDSTELSNKKVVVIDALLGTGIKGKLKGSCEEIIKTFKKLSFPVISIDLPSGLTANTGKVFSTPLISERCFTFQNPKICHYTEPACTFCGEVEVLDIGIYKEVIEFLKPSRRLLTQSFIRKNHKPRPKNSHKGTFGHLLVIGGSINMSGAPALSGFSALQAGCGLVSVFTPQPSGVAIKSLYPELMVISTPDSKKNFLSDKDAQFLSQKIDEYDCVLIGPGMAWNENTTTFLKELLPNIKGRLVLDADALNILSSNPELLGLLPEECVLTPHPKEFKRLMSTFEMDERLESAELYSSEKKLALVLKGAKTICSFPDGETFINPISCSGLATAGSGDVLAGIIASLLTQGYTMKNAVGIGVFMHSFTGHKLSQLNGNEWLTASRIADKFSYYFNKITNNLPGLLK